MTFNDKADRIVEQAKALVPTVNTWADFATSVFGRDGLIASALPDEAERQMFLDSPQYKALSQMRLQLIKKFGAEKGGTPEKSGRFLVRIPKSLHLMLEVEAKREGVSLNQLAVSKLTLPLKDRVDLNLTVLASAYEMVYDGYSVDRVVLDPDLNARFLSACRKLGATQSDYEINHALFDARKSGKITLPKATKRTEFRDYDNYQFASEIAVRILQRTKGVTLDQILCDPAMAFEFDEIARRLAPKVPSLNLRCAALNLRKTRRLTPLVHEPEADESVNLIQAGPLKLVTPSELPHDAGVYSLFDRNRPIFAGETRDLQKRIGQHQGGHMPDWLGVNDDLACILKYAPMPSVKGEVRDAWLLQFITRERPLLNFQSAECA
jgi:hypothetical protein